MSEQPAPEQEETAARLREEHAAFYQQQRETQNRRIEELEAKRVSDSETILHLRAVGTVLEYFGELTLTDFADKEFAAVEAVKRSLEPIVTEDGQVNRDAMVAAVDLVVTEMPYLVKPLDLGVPEVPQGPSGAPCGSGRAHRPKPHDYESLVRKYPAAYRD